LFDVRLVAPGLDAHFGVESLSGDCGFHIGREGEASLEAIRLADWLRALGSSRPWSGSVGWRSLADELRFHAACDALGHVSLSIERRPWQWSPLWSATITVSYALGDLLGLAGSVDQWFAP
jgi:hypothetical protein